jgi:hypothetical protein
MLIWNLCNAYANKYDIQVNFIYVMHMQINMTHKLIFIVRRLIAETFWHEHLAYVLGTMTWWCQYTNGPMND